MYLRGLQRETESERKREGVRVGLGYRGEGGFRV